MEVKEGGTENSSVCKDLHGMRVVTLVGDFVVQGNTSNYCTFQLSYMTPPTRSLDNFS